MSMISRRLCATLVAMLWCLSIETVPAAVGDDAEPIVASRYEYLVETVAGGTAADRRVFAEAALAALADAYRREVLTAREMARGEGNYRSLSAWAEGAEAFAQDLEAGLSRLGRASDVTLIPSERRDLRMVVDGRQYMVNAPRPDEQYVLEQDIADRLCRYFNCETQPETLTERTRRKASALEQSWAFGDDVPPTFSASDGLHCVYNDRTHLTLKRRVCEAVLHELRLVAEALIALKKRGATIDFDRLGLVTERGRQSVRYARFRTFELGLPVLANAPDQFVLARAWLAARVEGRYVNHFLNLPDEVIYATAARLSR